MGRLTAASQLLAAGRDRLRPPVACSGREAPSARDGPEASRACPSIVSIAADSGLLATRQGLRRAEFPAATLSRTLDVSPKTHTPSPKRPSRLPAEAAANPRPTPRTSCSVRAVVRVRLELLIGPRRRVTPSESHKALHKPIRAIYRTIFNSRDC